MATIRSYTTVEQSRKLEEILPLESADMCYIQDLLAYAKYGEYKPYIGDLIPAYGQGKIRSWSLAALISIIPQEIFNGEYIINITEGCDNKWILTYDHHENKNHSYYSLSIGADNLVDACVDMIIKLHELKML